MSYFNETSIRGKESGNKAEVNSDGSLKINDLNQEQLLSDILKQLKIMNFHLSLITDNCIGKAEVE